ncbi:S8 family serine peptidase [Rossellomorea arthrocnemi]
MKRVFTWMMAIGIATLPFYSPVSVQATGATEETAKELPERVIVKLKEPVEKTEMKGYSLLENQEDNSKPIITVNVPKGEEIEDFIKSLESSSDVEYAEADQLIKLEYIPTDPYYHDQWYHQTIESERTWDQTKGSSDIVVAVIDNGVDLNHPDINQHIVSPYDTVYDSPYTMSNGDHGTHVAGIIGSSMENGVGATGIAPSTSIMPIDVFTTEYAYISDVIEGIYYAVDQGADIINMSLGSYSYSDSYNEAIQYAHDNGVLVIAAAGNDNSGQSHYPSSYPNVISVASTNEYDLKSSFSNYGNDIDISAPGSRIFSTLAYSSYGYMSGTSMASPVVAGVAALMLANDPLMTNEEVVQRLYDTSDDLGASGKDVFFGHGRVNAKRALELENDLAPPHVSNVYDYSEYVSGTIESDGQHYIEVTAEGEVIGSGYAVNRSFDIQIPRQSAGTTLVVTVTGNGEKSETTIHVLDGTSPTVPIVNEVADHHTVVTGKSERSANIEVKKGTLLIGSATASMNGSFSVEIPKQTAGTELTVYAVDPAGNQSESTVLTVKDKTAPSKPTVNPVGIHSTTITGKAEAHAMVFAKVGTTDIGKATSNRSGDFTIDISKLKAGTEISVIAIDQAGNKSTSAKIQVQSHQPQLKKLIGNTRYSTAVEVSKQGWDSAPTVFVVNGSAIADGLTATPLASAHDAPILLTTRDRLPSETVAEMDRLGAKKIVLIGGSSVISHEVKASLMKKGYDVSRIGGRDRYETSLLLAKELDKVVDVKDAYVAYGKGEPDALSISAHSGMEKQPIILVEKKAVPRATYDWLKTEGLSTAYFIGGPAVLDSTVMKSLNTLTDKNVLNNRISGKTRHETNAKVIGKFYKEEHYPTVLIAKSETTKLVDALSAGPLASKLGVPVLLVSQDGLDESQINMIADKSSFQVHQVGGGINLSVVKEVLSYMQ